MTGDPVFTQVWPPPTAPSLMAFVDPADTRRGWARWWWDTDGTCHVQWGLPGPRRDPQEGLAEPDVVAVWARAQGWHVHGPYRPTGGAQ
ncbi:MAG TPA: hypothetical protein VM433_12550 [Mycobacteriales bacterium]|nr:hypothetical protein [Mycobacteriales bacterium]